MANFNMSAIKYLVNNLGLTAQLIPSPTQPLNCKYVIINGKQLKSSQWTKTQAENILLEYKEGGCTKKAIPDNMSFEHIVDPIKEIKKFIEFKGNSLTYCLEKYRTMTENDDIYSVNHYLDTLEDIHGDSALNILDNLLNNNEIFIINEFVYSIVSFKYVIDAWLDENHADTKITDYKSIINKYSKAVENM